ncbi:MAG: FAD-dependent oxidoreductase [bacterium]
MAATQRHSQKIVIVGNGAAGLAAAEEIIKRDQKIKVLLLSNEQVPPYSKPLISHILAGETAESQVFLGLGKLENHPQVEFRTDADVEALEPKSHRLILRSGESLEYDQLLIATGSVSVAPPIPGLQLPGVHPFITLEHMRRIERRLPGVRQAVVLGGGLIGLRAAYALKERGIDVTVVEILPYVLGSVLDRHGSDLIVSLLEQRGIKMRLNSKITSVEGDPNRDVVGVSLEGGERLPCQLLVQCAGVLPAVACLKDSGIERQRGALVDEFLRTSSADVFAAGDCAEPVNPITEKREIVATWTQARLQGKIAGRNLTGVKESCPVGLAENSIGFFGVPCITFGITEPPDDSSFEVFTQVRQAAGTYRKIVIKNGRIVGAVFLKDIEGAGLIDMLIHKRVDVSAVKDGILNFRKDFVELLKSLQAEELRGDVEWPEIIGMTIEYHKRLDEKKWQERQQR